MNNAVRHTATRFFRLLAAALFLVPLFYTSAMAGDGPADWRPMYDTIMMWVNFLILAFVIFYYGKTPLLNWLKGQQKEVSDEIGEMEQRKQAFERQIEETRQMISDSSARFDKIKSRITEEGKRKRQEIIDQANEQSRKMLEMEKKKAANQIVQAKQLLLAELTDTAGDMALNRLPREITDADQDNMLSLYINQITQYAEQAG